jgi:hypothetical protein
VLTIGYVLIATNSIRQKYICGVNSAYPSNLPAWSLLPFFWNQDFIKWHQSFESSLQWKLPLLLLLIQNPQHECQQCYAAYGNEYEERTDGFSPPKP